MKAFILRRSLLAMLLALPFAAVQAQNFPERPIRLIIPFAPASGTDLIARAIAKGVTEGTGAAVIIDNRPGGEGFLGSQGAARGAPDGYTLLMAGSSTQVVNVHLFKKLPYDPIKDFVPVIPLARTSMLLTVNGKAPETTTQALIDAAKNKPGALSFGSGSATTRLAGEFFQQQAGVKMLHVPYRSPALAINGLLGDQVNMVFIGLPTISGHLANGGLRALAVSGHDRMAALPDIPTLRELGLKDFDLTAWYGIWAPAGTPAPVVKKLHEIFAKAMTNPDVKTFFANASMDTFTMSPEEFAKFQREETDKIGKVMQAAGIEQQ